MHRFDRPPLDFVMDDKSLDNLSASTLSSNVRDEERGADCAVPQTVEKAATGRLPDGGVLSRTLFKVRTRDSLNPGPPPDGGWRAWSQALLCHLVIFNTWGFINSFGLFQTYYTTALKEPPSNISWIGSVQIFTPFFIGAFSGRATDAGFFKLTFTIGMIIQLLGIFMTSLCKTYWQVFLAHGVCVGIGNGLVFIPALTITSTYFLPDRSLAVGVAASGSATGGLVYPAIAEQLLPKVGFGWTVRVMGRVLETSTTTEKRRANRRMDGVQGSAVWPICAFFISAVFGLYTAFYYVGSFGHDILSTSQATSIDLLLTMNGVGIPGRLIPNYLADRSLGPLNCMAFFGFACCIIIYSWISVTTTTGLWVFTVVYGAFAAGIQSLFPATLASLNHDPKKAGTRIGMVFCVAGFAVLSGPPLTGALIQMDNGGYLYAQVFAGSAMGAGFFALLAARWAKVGGKLKAKV